MPDPEVAVNLWYVVDEEGVIYSLRAKAYALDGSDEDKLGFLRERALWDYLVAKPFEIPARFHLEILEGRSKQKMPVAHVSMLTTLDSPIALFEDALKDIEMAMPAQSNISIPESPLTCTTALMQDQDGVIRPRITGVRQY